MDILGSGMPDTSQRAKSLLGLARETGVVTGFAIGLPRSVVERSVRYEIECNHVRSVALYDADKIIEAADKMVRESVVAIDPADAVRSAFNIWQHRMWGSCR